MPPARGRPTKGKELWLAKDPFLRELQTACHLAATATGPETDRTRQTEDSFFRAAVAFEAFLSDWLARCLRFDTSKLNTAANRAAEKHVKKQLARWSPENGVIARAVDKYPPTNQVTVTITIPKTVSIERARELLGVV